MKIIFLDFDGVIRVALEGGWIGPDAAQFCQDRMRSLAWACDATGARIVVSSDWRTAENRAEIEDHLSPHLSGYLHEDWATPICGKRWNEVQRWLLRHPEVSDYAILEDWEQHFEGCPPEMRARLHLCNNRHGLVPAITCRLVEQLGPAPKFPQMAN